MAGRQEAQKEKKDFYRKSGEKEGGIATKGTRKKFKPRITLMSRIIL
jgi:hypothetical protein